MHTFKHVFEPESSQSAVFDRVGMPLVEDLLAGKNGTSRPPFLSPFHHQTLYHIGLLFAYGITNSGKTYTVNGEPEQAGLLPRSLDVIFNSINDVQTLRYVSNTLHLTVWDFQSPFNKLRLV